MNDIHADQPMALSTCSCHICNETIRAGNAPTQDYMGKSMWFASVDVLLITYFPP